MPLFPWSDRTQPERIMSHGDGQRLAGILGRVLLSGPTLKQNMKLLFNVVLNVLEADCREDNRISLVLYIKECLDEWIESQGVQVEGDRPESEK